MERRLSESAYEYEYDQNASVYGGFGGRGMCMMCEAIVQCRRRRDGTCRSRLVTIRG